MIDPTPTARRLAPFALAALAALSSAPLRASSHREAPAITEAPKIDATDFYMFTSYEPGRADYVTLVANYLPLQDPYGGPNYFTLDSRARYEIKIDNDGDAREDLTFRFRFNEDNRRLALQVGPPGATKSVAVPLINIGPIADGDTTFLNRRESYTLDVVRHGVVRRARNADTGETTFLKPVDNIGLKSIPDYESYAAAHLYDLQIPACSGEGRVFVGQRKDPFVVNLGEVFDLVNIANPIGSPDAESDDLADANVTSLVLEIPKSCLVSPSKPVIGGWTTASLPDDDDGRGEESSGSAGYRQLSRLGMPLVNEVVIGLEDKDRFNGSHPRSDAQFLKYVTHPTLPELLEILFGAAGVRAPDQFPRTDLVAAFLTGIDGLNRTERAAEMLRLNTAIAPVAGAQQSSLGVLGNDLAGFPNGRRPGDDVVDIELRVAMGVLLPPAVAPSGQLPFTDGAAVDASFFDDEFPYLRTPLPGSPND